MVPSALSAENVATYTPGNKLGTTRMTARFEVAGELAGKVPLAVEVIII
jgi:hypothetical protein